MDELVSKGQHETGCSSLTQSLSVSYISNRTCEYGEVTPMVRLHYVAKVKNFTVVIKVPNYLILSSPEGDYPRWARPNQVSHSQIQDAVADALLLAV